MLTPEGGGGTVVYLDDFSFATTVALRPANPTSDPDEPFEPPAPTSTPRPSDTPVPSATQSAVSEAQAQATGPASTPRPGASSTASRSTPQPGSTLTRTPVQETLASRDDRTLAVKPVEPDAQEGIAADPRSKPETPLWAVGAVAFIVSLGGGYWLSKHPVG